MGVWNLIESILSEDKKFRGDSFVTYADLVKLFVGKPPKQPGITGRPPDRNGGAEFGSYKFDPNILALGDSPEGDALSWHDDLESALARATTDSAKSIQGTGMGGTMVKGNWGGGVSMQRAPVRPHHNDRLGSGMDRYDVIIVADIEFVMNRRGLRHPVGVLRRIAWAPSMGSQAERSERLQSLLAGRQVTLPRRPMADRPVPPNKDPEAPEVPNSDVQRTGGRMGLGGLPPRDQELQGMGMGYRRKNPVPSWLKPGGVAAWRKKDED